MSTTGATVPGDHDVNLNRVAIVFPYDQDNYQDDGGVP